MGLLHSPRTAATNVRHLDDYRVPSYRRNRPASRPVDGASGVWTRLAHERAAGSAQPRAAAALALAPSPAPGVLRVTHFPASATARGAVGRLRISGRLADVCAELDRLAAIEAGCGADGAAGAACDSGPALAWPARRA